MQESGRFFVSALECQDSAGCVGTFVVRAYVRGTYCLQHEGESNGSRELHGSYYFIPVNMYL